jgi:hypothetical protein
MQNHKKCFLDKITGAAIRMLIMPHIIKYHDVTEPSLNHD